MIHGTDQGTWIVSDDGIAHVPQMRNFVALARERKKEFWPRQKTLHTTPRAYTAT